MKEIATFEVIDDLLRCDYETGLCYWKKSTSRVCEGDVAGHKRHDGYVDIGVNGRVYLAHRIVWLLKTGEWPNGQIDHVDGDRSNNRLENLRDVNNRINGMNSTIRSDNTSGSVGVIWNRSRNRWHAQISDENGRKHLGNFVNIHDAIAARKAAEIELGYHLNHGKKKSS